MRETLYRNWLLENLDLIEKGLHDVKIEERVEDGESKVDVMAKDRNDEIVVLEFKGAVAMQDALAKVDEYRRKVQAKRAIIVAPYIEPDVKILAHERDVEWKEIPPLFGVLRSLIEKEPVEDYAIEVISFETAKAIWDLISKSSEIKLSPQVIEELEQRGIISTEMLDGAPVVLWIPDYVVPFLLQIKDIPQPVKEYFEGSFRRLMERFPKKPERYPRPKRYEKLKEFAKGAK